MQFGVQSTQILMGASEMTKCKEVKGMRGTCFGHFYNLQQSKTILFFPGKPVLVFLLVRDYYHKSHSPFLLLFFCLFSENIFILLYL